MPVSQVVKYANTNHSRFVEELAEFVRFPTVGSQPNHAKDMGQCAIWLTDQLQKIGLHRAEMIQTDGHPIVYAESRQRYGCPTVLIYGHYDVQPAEPLQAWKSPPFQPVVRNSYLYGRGASDDKGQLFTHIKALECYLQTTGELPLNIKCLFEGEEEIGSPHLNTFLTDYTWDLGADVAVISDMPIIAPDRPAITYALRGAISLELQVEGPQRELHSGIYGGAIHNPLQVLCEIIGRLHDPYGRIAIPGFYDHVQTWDSSELEYMAQIGPTEQEILRNARVLHGWGEPNFSSYERTTIRPSLSVNGIVGGYQGDGPKAVIPGLAVAKLNFRLVPNQDPLEIERLLRQYIANITPRTVRSRIQTQFTASPIVLERPHPAMQAASHAYFQGFGTMPVFLRCGGTIPVVNMLHNILGIPTVLMGFALPDDQMHAPNEKFYLPNFFNGIKTSISFLSEVARRMRPVQKSAGTTAGLGVLP
jgi:Acetylornithine deacetylase/Succinyl-diaminopimelate desuccinylase and related deacylases